MRSCAGDRVDQGLQRLLEDVHFLKQETVVKPPGSLGGRGDTHQFLIIQTGSGQG